MSKNLKVSLWRGGQDGAFQDFEVPKGEHQTVLDVITYVQRHLDATLAYRFACRVGMCGSCAMTVNGISRWTCRTHVKQVAHDDRLQIAPLRNLPIVKDLVTDMVPFFDKWKKAGGAYVSPTETCKDFAVVQPDSPERRRADVTQECIGCGVCYSSCDIVSWKPEYLGPAALNRAWVQINDVRDAGNPQRLQAVTGEGGCHSCHSQQSCTLRCPMSLDPAGAIAGLKRMAFKATLKGEL